MTGPFSDPRGEPFPLVPHECFETQVRPRVRVNIYAYSTKPSQHLELREAPLYCGGAMLVFHAFVAMLAQPWLEGTSKMMDEYFTAVDALAERVITLWQN
jgi:hypothetical protein